MIYTISQNGKIRRHKDEESKQGCVDKTGGMFHAIFDHYPTEGEYFYVTTGDIGTLLVEKGI